MKLKVSEDTINRVFDLLKLYQNVSNIALGQALNISRISIFHAIRELKRRKWIKPKAERINNVVQYQITKKE